MVSFYRYFAVCITYQPPLVLLLLDGRVGETWEPAKRNPFIALSGAMGRKFFHVAFRALKG